MSAARFVSTRGRSPAADLETAVFSSLAADGGLYLPAELPRLPPGFFEHLPGRPLVETAAEVAAALLPELPPTVLRSIVEESLDFPVPLVELEPGVRLLELFHGPTLAFKDVGARFMARLFAHFGGDSGSPLTVLVATSGDTGGAVAQAFLGVAGTRVAVLYPRGRVSPVQECQFTTLSGNVQALAVEGSFDDCQRLVKAAFADQDLARRRRLTSANSINLARLLPQIFSYFHAAAQLPPGSPPPLFAVPSGNFGNLTAGLLAERLGLDIAGFVAATNANDVVPQYLESGLFEPRPSVTTLSSAMDVGDPSNFERILHLFGGARTAIRRRVRGERFDDDATREAIRDVFRRTGTVLDPHTAVGYLALKRTLLDEPGASGVVLATAHPAKFREHVEPLVGRTLAVPERLARCLELPRRFLPLAPEETALSAFLESW